MRKSFLSILGFCFLSFSLGACGSGPKSASSIKIVSGQEMQRSDPLAAYAVSIDFWNETTATYGHCTGTLIHPKWVLSAAHCQGASYSIDSYEGSHRRESPITASESYRPESPLVTAPEFGATGFEQPLNDILLIYLPQPLAFPAGPGSAPIAALEQFFSAQTLWLVGSGQHDGGNNERSQLQGRRLDNPFLLAPKRAVLGLSLVTNPGDSGGGLFRRKDADDSIEILGVLSGNLAGQSVCTYLASFRPWIEATMRMHP